MKFRPIFKERIWGGQQLRDVFGKDLPEDIKIGESWELADLPEDKSQIVNGPLAGLPAAVSAADQDPGCPGCAQCASASGRGNQQTHGQRRT
ncbi:MAG: hypothetical protein ACYSOY_04905 [Planctomycetota bacterium]